MATRTCRVTLVQDDRACFIPVLFDPKTVFGKIRAPVRVTLNGYSYRSTIASMGDCLGVPLRRSHREAAALAGNETVDVTFESDDRERIVDIPVALSAVLSEGDRAKWDRFSYTRRKEHVDAILAAKRTETRERRIARAIEDIRSV